MTSPLPLLSENCPSCNRHAYFEAAKAWAEKTVGGTPAPIRFGLQCPHCRAALTVEVIVAIPLIFRFSLQRAPETGVSQ